MQGDNKVRPPRNPYLVQERSILDIILIVKYLTIKNGGKKEHPDQNAIRKHILLRTFFLLEPKLLHDTGN